MKGMCSTTGKNDKAFLIRRPQGERNSGHLRIESRYKIFLKILVGIIESISLIRFKKNSNHFFSFGARAPLWALVYLHETLRFTSAY
jgi:hypothetical protein